MGQLRTADGILRLLRQENPLFVPVEIWAYNDAVNRNNWRFINLEQHRKLWAGVPLLVAYVNGGRTVGSGHNQTKRRTPEGEEYVSFTDATAERIVGAVSDDDGDIRLVERDGSRWVVCRGYLYAWYCRELVDKLVAKAEQGGEMAVSIEALVTSERMEDGVAVEEEYTPLGITLLGERVEPAVADAHIAMLAAKQEELKVLKLRAAALMGTKGAGGIAQKNLKEEGRKRNMRLSKQQLREMQTKFGDKHRVLAAEHGESGVDVCLLGSDGATYLSRLSSAEEDVDMTRYPERVVRVNAQVHFCAGDTEICVDASDLTECVSAEAAEAKGELEKCRAELETCKAEMETMRTRENERRLAAARKMAEDTLCEFNRDRKEKVDAKRLEALYREIDGGAFTALCDEKGAWTGDSAVQEKVLSLCARADMDYQKKLAAKLAEQTPMTWGSVWQASSAPGTVGELFASQN